MQHILVRVKGTAGVFTAEVVAGVNTGTGSYADSLQGNCLVPPPSNALAVGRLNSPRGVHLLENRFVSVIGSAVVS